MVQVTDSVLPLPRALRVPASPRKVLQDFTLALKREFC